ncbi:AGAP007118-PA [Anopheles gambiae str. PEST]|uniref:AGAP007118-PA n=1 Tax=Anopheles gambiae TaxID=7165 RepID=A0NBJ5_ANOGA|nr:AGAP007118-PA [Anopheles gambiae str. PEST]
MLDAIVYNGCTHRLLRLGVALMFVSTLVDLLAASPTTVYDSYGDNRALPVRVDDRSSGGTFFSSPLHPPLSAQQGAEETLPPVQQQLVVSGGGGVTRVPWYGLTELSDVLLLGVLVTVAVLGTLLFVVLVLGLRAKLHLLRQDRAAAGDDRAELTADYAQECSAIKCVGSGGKGKVIKTPPASPPILLLEAGAVVKPVPTTCIAVTGVDGGRRRTEQHLNQSDKRHRSPGGRGSKRRPPPVASGQPLPVATVNMSASIGATASIDSATSSASGRETTEHVTIDDKDRLHRGQPRAEQGEEQQQPVSPLPSAPPPPSDKRNVLKRQAVAELSVFAGLPAPGTPGSGSPTAYLQLLTPLSASSLSTSAATTDNNATPTKGEPGGGSATGGGPLSAAESMAAARFGFSPRSIHSFTMQTATYFRFPDVDDFTPTPRTLPKRHGGTGGDETCSTPPAVDARTEEEEEDGGGQLRRTERETAAPKVAVLAPSPGSMPLPPSPPAKGNPKEGEVTQDVVAAIVEQMEQLHAPPPPPPASTSIEPHRPTARICAPMANRRVRLKSISLDSEGARLVEENLTSTIPVQELVGMAAHRTGGFDSVIDDDDDDEEENERDDDDDDDDDGHDERANASAAHDETDEDEDEAAAAAKQRSAARAKRVRNILNLRLNIPPLPTGGGTGSMATQGRPPPPGASQSTGSVAKPIVKTVTVTGSVSNPTMSTQQQQQQPTLHHRHHIEDSNEQFYFEYFDYGDEEDETDDEYDEVEYGEEHEDNNNNNNNNSSSSGSHTVALPPVPKTPTLSQYKQKASSLDSDKLKISIQYGGSGGGGGGGNGGGGNSTVYSSVSCGGGMSTIMSIAQCQGQGMSLHNTYSHTQQQFGQFQFHQQPQQQLQQPQQQHTSQQPAGQLQQPRRVSSVSVPTTPKRYQYRTAANHHYYHHQQQQQQQQHYASGQSKLKPSYHPGPAPAPSAGGDSGGATANGNRKEKKSPLGLKAMGGCGGEGGTTPTQPQSQSPSEQGGKQDDGTKPSVPTSGRSSILQRRGSNHSLTLNLDVYNRSGGSVDLTSSSCTSLYRGSYKNLHQVQSHTQLYQPAHQHPVEPPVRVQCHQASPQQPVPGAAAAGDGTTTTSGTMHNNNNNNSNGSNANTSKKNLLQRRGSNTSLTLNLRSGVGAGGGTGSTFGLNRFSSHNSLNTGMASALGASNSHQHHSQQQQQQYHQQQHQQHQQQFPSSSMVRLAGSRKSLLERRNSNASLTLINVNQRTLSVSNCNLRGSICSLNSLLTTHTQNEPGPSDMMLEEDELDGNGDNDHHHYHHHHHHHNHHHHHHHHGQHGGHSGPHHGGLHRGGGEGELRRFGSSVDAPFTGTDGGGVQSEMGRAGSRYNQAHERSEQQHHQHLHHAVGGGGGGHHEESRSARQRKFRSSDSLHNINVREQGPHGGHGAAGPLQSRLMDADSKLMSGSGYPQCSCHNSNVRNISTKPLSPQTTSEDFKIYLANIQFLQNASNVLTMAYLRKLHNFFTKTYRKMVAATATAAQEAFQQQQQQKEDAAHKGQHESTKADGEAATTAGTKMMLLHSDSLHHPPVCDDESYEEEHKRMVLKIHQEFWDLPTNYQEKPLVFGSQAKNRYKTILPNEHSRVILEPERSPAAGGEPYINANYIKGPDYANNSYIATQGPLPNTIYEFWLMVYQNVVRTATVAGRSCASAGLEQKIVMLTNFVENGRQKCAIYFPQTADEWVAFGSGADIDVGEMLREKDTITASIAAAEQQPEGQEAVGGVCQPVTVRVPCASCFFLVHNVAVEQRNGYTVRTLNVIYGAKVSDADAPDGDGSRALFELTQFRAHHYWFPDWPDHRSPKDINVLLDLSLDVLGSNVVDTPRPESSNSLKGNQPGTPGLEEVMGAAQLAALSSSCTPTVLPIVHCSAGIGRTGCLIAILNGLRQLRLSVMAHQRKQQQLKQSQAQTGEAGQGELHGSEGRRKSTVQMDGATLLAPNAAVGRGGQREGSAVVRESGQVDILGIVCNLRLQRGGMVQNSEQYELIHRALCLYLEKLTQDGQI